MAKRRSVNSQKKKRPPIYIASRRKKRGRKITRKYNKARRKLIKKLRLMFLGVLSVAITVFLLTGISVYKFLNAPFSVAYQTNYNVNKDIWSGHEATILAIKVSDINNPYSDIQNLIIVNFNKTAKRYSIYHVPVDTEIEYALNYGRGPIRRIYAVGNADQKRGVYLLKNTIFKLFAINPDGYIITDQKGWDHFNEALGKIDEEDLSASLRLRNVTKIPRFYKIVRNETIANLRLVDIQRILGFIRETSHTSSFVYRLNKYYLLDPSLWDDLWQERPLIAPVQREGVKVFVANASDPKIPGLASWGSRVVENLGIQVLEVDNSPVNFSENTIITSDPNLETVKELQKALHIRQILLKDELDKTKSYNNQIKRTKVSLMLVKF